MATLYRCTTPTDYLCPCGKVARALRRAGIDYEEVRVPARKRDRPEIEELTGQRNVPVLVHGEEVVHDSRRILQYLDWKYGAGESASEREDVEATEEDREAAG
jgi:glutaredoxin 3